MAAIEHGVGHYPGIVIDQKYPLMLVDLDNCIGDDGTLSDLARTAVAAADETYIEHSASGRFVEFCRDVFARNWYGDLHILDAVLLMAACYKITNIRMGVNLHIAGKTQSGKSEAAKHALKFIPPENRLDGTFSKLALFSGFFRENQIVFSDDTQFWGAPWGIWGCETR